MQINRYTRQVMTQQAVPQTYNPNEVQQAGQMAAVVSDVSGGIAEGIQAQQQKAQTRYETIQRARSVSAYQSEADQLFTKFSQENDLTDPNSAKNFNQELRKRMGEYLSQHDGGVDSKISLELQLTGLQDSYTAKMSQTAVETQKKFITNQIGTHIDRITNEVYNNPSSIDDAFKQINGLMYEYGSAVDTQDELEMLSNAQSMVIEGAVNSFLDAGNYEDAKKMVEDNARFFEVMPAKQQMSILGRINNGIASQERETRQLKNKINAIQSAAKEAGVDMSANQVFGAATGITPNQTPQQKIDSFKQVAGLDDSRITPAIVAKIGFGVDLPSSGEVDMNKERLPDGGYTPKGIGAQIKPAYDNAAATKVMVDKVLLQSDEFINSDNKQAGLAAIISYNKLLDDGAVVREGDIKLSAEGNSAFDNMKLMMEKINEGGIATPKQIEEMKASAKIFGESVLEASKTYIDPYLDESQQRGYRMIDIGIPRDSYDRVFSNVKTSEDKSQRNKDVEAKAKEAGLSVNEYLTAGAKKYNMTVEQVAEKLGYTGGLK